MDRMAFESWLKGKFAQDPVFISECLKIVDKRPTRDISPVMVLREINRQTSSIPFEIQGLVSEIPLSSQ